MPDGIRLAQERDLPALCALWKTCFGDPEEYVRFFYRENAGFVTTTVYTVDDRPVSMLHWFDASFVDGEDRRKAKYLYAGGTLPEYRGKGYYGAVIRFVLDYADRNGCLLFGKPAERSLVTYYRRFGFEKDACFRFVTLRPGERVPIRVRPLAPEEYNRMRNAAFSARPFAAWQDRYVRTCVRENAFLGGRTIAVGVESAEYFLMGAPKDGALRITETNLPYTLLSRTAGALCALFGTDLLKAYLPGDACLEGEEIVSSVVYNGPLRNTYVNLILI